MKRQLLLRRPVVAWALYDWANSAFATSVMAGFFPVVFKQFWSAGADVTHSTARLGFANGLAGLIIALLAPVLGAIGDRGGMRKGFLLSFAALGITTTVGLYFVERGDWSTAAMVYVLGTVGFMGANVFNDSLLIDVAHPDREHYDLVSAFGFSLGYLGGGLLYVVNVAMVLKPEWFGLADKGIAVRVAFISVAVWWALFTLPLILFVKELPTRDRQPMAAAVPAGLRQLRVTLREARALRPAFYFLIAYWLYIDGVHTVIQMAVDYGLALGFADTHLLIALGITQFVGFPATLAFGLLGERVGTRTALLAGIATYLAVTVWAAFLNRVEEFYAMAVVIGLVQGGVQSLSRALYARLIPADKSGEFFGLYNMIGKFAAVLGPVIVAWAALATGSNRAGVLAIAVLFIAGGALLMRVDSRAGGANREAVGATPDK